MRREEGGLEAVVRSFDDGILGIVGREGAGLDGGGGSSGFSGRPAKARGAESLEKSDSKVE